MPCENNAKTSSEIEHVDWSTGTGSGHNNYANVRFGSGSSQASQSSGDICRICHCESDPQNPLLTPCYCSGSLKYVHQSCLQQWLTASDTNSCELCKFPFIMHTKIKPFNEWRSLDISGIERRRLCCSVLFHCAAALCVIWSLCVLIERAADDVQRGLIDWPFWTKLAVVTVGLTGGIVFMYIQCKAYLHLCHRWKARNRILLIQNAPEKIHPPPSPVTMTHAKRSSRASEQYGVGMNTAAAAVAHNGAVEINTSAMASSCATYGGQHCTVAVGDGCLDNASACAAAAAAMQHNQRLLNASPRHMLQQAELDMLDSQSAQSAPTQPTSHQLQQQAQKQLQLQQQVAANIECAQLQQNYERDWALDDVVSQISSFRPCPQGSGSMTPFHDSIHNVLEHSEASSRGSVNDLCVGSRQDLSTGGISTDTGGRDNALQLSSFSGSGDNKAPSISSGVSNAVANGLGGFVYRPHTNNKRYSNSSIFLENRDILNDTVALGSDLSNAYDYSTHPKIDYRHSSTLATSHADATTSDVVTQAAHDTFIKDLRRYSDTKLLGSVIGGGTDEGFCNDEDGAVLSDAQNENDAMLFKPTIATSSVSMPNNDKRLRQLLLQKQHEDIVLDMELPTSPLSPPAAYASQCLPSQTLRRSLDVFGDDVTPVSAADAGGGLTANATHAAVPTTGVQIDRSRLFFKSLPNLSSSCESLIKK